MAKEKPLKERSFSFRATKAEGIEIDNYIDAADVDQSEMLRKATKEYMMNHPIRSKEPEPTNSLKPGD